MIKINLLPVRAAKKKESLRQQISVGILSLVLVVLAIGYVHYQLIKDVANVEERIASTKTELERTKAQIGEVSKFKEMKRVLEDKLGVIKTLKVAKTGPVMMLDDLSRATPEKLWMTTFKEQNKVVSIDGMALGNEIVAQFMTELENSRYLKEVELIVTEQVEFSGLKLKKFSLTAKLEG